jgi:hypothetical protein
MATRTARGRRSSLQTASARSFPTKPDDALTPEAARRARTWRRAGVGLVVGILVLALTGFLGERTSVVTAEGGGYRVTVDYPSVVRPGNDVRLNVVVTNRAGSAASSPSP